MITFVQPPMTSTFRRCTWTGPAWVWLAVICLPEATLVYSQAPDGFNPGTDGMVRVLAVQTDGKVLVGGSITNLAGQPRKGLGRLNADGKLDTNFTSVASDTVISLAIESNGNLMVAGSFTNLCGQICTNLGRLNRDGVRDTSFNPNPTSAQFGDNSRVAAVLSQPDGRIIIGGSFTNVSGQGCTNFARLLSNGEPDPDFHIGITRASLNTIALQPDGGILVQRSTDPTFPLITLTIARLNPNGALDATFNASIGGNPVGLDCLAVQPDGKILVGGRFTELNGNPCVNLGRLNSDGSFDADFDPGAQGYSITTLALQADGKILVGGWFTSLGGQPRANLARLNGNGTLDTSFTASADNAVLSLAIQPDGKILVGGAFTNLCGVARSCLGRLNNTESATQSLSLDDSSIIWLRSGASPEVWRTTFEMSTNGGDWIKLGAGTRIAGGWQLTGLTLPANCTVRARGFVAAGQAGASSWFVETNMLVGPSNPPTIVVNDDRFGIRTNRFGFNVSGAAGQVIVVEMSTNLLDWNALATNTVGSDPYYVSDPVLPEVQKRFYRVRLQ